MLCHLCEVKPVVFFVLGICVPFVTCEPTAVIPQTCQLNVDVPQVTQLLNLTKIPKPELKARRDPVAVQEIGMLFYSNAISVFYIVCSQLLAFLLWKCIVSVNSVLKQDNSCLAVLS